MPGKDLGTGSTQEDMFLLTFDLINETQRGQIQAAVAREATAWSHQQANIWIVRGRSALFWRDLVRPFVEGVPGNLLVFQLPEMGKRRWTAFAPKSWFGWFEQVMLGKTVEVHKGE